MDAHSIVERIDKDARASATAVLQDAKQRAVAIQDASEQKIKDEQAAMLTMATHDVAVLEDRMRRMALLEDRKLNLSAKRAVLDEAFRQVLDKMFAMPEADARSFGLTMLLSCAAGNETIVPDITATWCDQMFVKEANRALQKAGKQASIVLSTEKQNVGGGFVLMRNGMEINCSYKAAIDTQRLTLEAEVAALLFS